MSEVSEQKEKPGGHEELVYEVSAARTRPTSVAEIMLRRKRKERLENVKEEAVGAIQLQGSDLVEKASDYHESETAHARSKKTRHEERVKGNSCKKEDANSNIREEKLEKPMKEDFVGAAQLLGTELVENVSDYHELGKGHDRPKKGRRDSRVNESSRKNEDAISCSREEKPMKEDPVGAAQLLGKDLVVKDSDNHESKTLRHEKRVKESSSIKEHPISTSRVEKPMKEEPEGATQSLGNDLVKTNSDYHVSEKGHAGSKKVRHEERIKESLRKKEDAISYFREEKLEKLRREDPVGAAQLLSTKLVEKVSDYHQSEKGHDRSKKVMREERFKESSRKKEDTVSSSKDEKLKKEDLVGTAQLPSNNPVEKVLDYNESEKGYGRSEKPWHEEHVKDSSRKKEEAIFSSREERVDRQRKEEERTNRKRRAEGEGSRAERNLVEQHIKDRRRKKEETTSSSREEKLDKNTTKKDLAANRKKSTEGEFPATEIKTTKYRDGLGVETKMKAKRENDATKTTEKQIHPHDTGREERCSAHENSSSSRKRLRSLVVADIPRDEDSMQPDNGSKQKNQNGDDKNNRDRNMSKRHDPGKVQSVQVSERGEKTEQSKSRQRDMREKRRRSRSRDHGQDRQKRSSPLPRAEKATLRRKRNHEEHSENALKDKSGKHQFNDFENEVASTVNYKSRRYSSSKSELGGYSPRKRREEASAKPASPPSLSSEKKGGKWDLPHSVTADFSSGSVFPGLQAPTQTAYPAISEASLTLLKPLMDVPFRMPLARQTTSVDSVQLTESTRRMRRLYAENVPDSASEKSLIECLNGYMLSSGSNQIKGTEPCISCIINKEKGQALLEFLTPQDASAALSLDGCSFAGSNLKLRRPKDYVETTSVELEKKEPATNALSDNVEDSSSKIFIGGFPKEISSEMLMEIVSVFGPLKAYRFVTNNDLNQRCAFLEYADGSVTPKACAGLNGMKLGGSVITAVCAFPDASSIAVNANQPFYGIPQHAKPLLGKPKHILKLKNVVDPEDLPSLSEPEMKEILEDVRLECARFGVIKSINIIEHQSRDIAGSAMDAPLNPEPTDSKTLNVSVTEEKDEGSKTTDDIADSVDPEEVVKPDNSTGEDKLCEPRSDTAAETNTQANEDHDSNEQDHCEKIDGKNTQDKRGNLQGVGSVRAVKTRWDTGEKIEEEEDPKDVFEPGCIFIEYTRPEATRDAAHSLHGRLYENRIVKAGYVSKELYQIRFPSG